MDDCQGDEAEKTAFVADDDWESIFDTVTDSVTIHDADFNIVRINQSAREMLGLQLRDPKFLAKCFRYYHGTDEPPSGCASCQTLQTGRPSTVEIFEPFLNKHLEIRALPRFGGEGKIAGLIHIARDITERKRAEQALQQAKDALEERSKNLEEMNTALHVLLQKREEDKRKVEELIVANIKSLVYPYLEKIRNDAPNAKQNLLVSIIETHLNELLSPLLKNIQQFNLTPKEVQIAAMIKDGRTTKEIAEILGVATSSIDTHRNGIRKKLGLNRNVNLQSKLQSLQ